MARGEEIKKESQNRYPYIKGLPQTLAHQEIFIEGAKWADKTMIERVRKWLYTIDFDSQSFRDCDETFNNDLFIDTLCKVMEE